MKKHNWFVLSNWKFNALLTLKVQNFVFNKYYVFDWYGDVFSGEGCLQNFL